MVAGDNENNLEAKIATQSKTKDLRELVASGKDDEPALQVAALPWRKKGGQIEIMLITSRDTGRWVLPKGWPEKGESLSQSAGREALEEAGIHGQMAKYPLGSFHYDKILTDGSAQPCRVEVFPMKVKQEDKRWQEWKERERSWVTPEDAATMVDEADLGELLAGFSGKSSKTAA